MKPNATEIEEKIRAFLDGKLSPEEAAIFRNEINQDEHLKHLIKETEDLKRAIEVSFSREEAKRVLLDLRKPKPLRVFFKSAGIAAGILLIAIFTYLTFSKDYFATYEINIPNFRGTNQKVKLSDPFEEFMLGREAYLSGDFTKASHYFNMAINEKNEPLRPYFTESVKWNLCVSYLLDNEPQKALEIFNELNVLAEPRFPVHFLTRWKIRWQIGLNLLLQKKKQK